MNERPHYNLLIGPEGLRAGWALLLFFSVFSLAYITFPSLFYALHLRPSTAHSALTGIAPRTFFFAEIPAVLAVVLATWTMSRLERQPIAVYGITGKRKLPRFLAGLTWGAALLSLLIVTLKFTGLLVFDRRLLSGSAIVSYGALWSVGFLLVALFEESLMRGYLQFTLTRGCAAIYRLLGTPHSQTFGFWTAALILSILFGLGHHANPGESRLGLLSAALVGLVFCLSLWRTGSLWWAIGFHASWDWAQSFLYGVADSGTMVQHHLFATHPVGRALLSGGTTGPEGSLYIIPTLALTAIMIVLTLPRTTSTTNNG